MTVYTVELYHDTPENAAENTTSIGWHRTQAAARKAAKAALTDYWNSASVGRGTFTPAVLGVSPEYVEYEESLRYIGPDWDDPA